jgi:penicillin-binding protein 2
VLALVSMPTFDPNLFVDGIDPDTWKSLNESPERPMVNRVLRGIYPPGSTIKPLMALAGLELGVRKPGDHIADPGYFTLPNSSHQFRDWKRGGHGVVDLRRSISQSCDIYYYQLAVDMGIDRMHDYLAKFGLGEKTGIDLEGESSGLLPSREWKQRRWKQPWYPGETVIAGIGQGYHLSTPLQLAMATAMLANGGQRIEPRLVAAVRDPRTHAWEPLPGAARSAVAIDPAHLELVREGMKDVMRPGGTAAKAAAGAPYTIAGKTGTAQVVSLNVASGRGGAWKYRDHGLFIFFAPFDRPRYAGAVVIEHGGGSGAAYPIARDVMTFLFDPPKGLEALHALEEQWGGTAQERLNKAYVAYATAAGVDLPPAPPDPVAVARAVDAEARAAVQPVAPATGAIAPPPEPEGAPAAAAATRSAATAATRTQAPR